MSNAALDHALLIVEDDADVQRAARVALTPHAQHIEMLGDTEQLEACLAARSFDAVLLDMNFVTGERSGNAGLNALMRIQAVDRNLAVVLMTAYGGVALAVEALKQGAVDFILKPWRNDKLIAAVNNAVNVTYVRRDAEVVTLESLERSAIERALTHHNGNISLAAAALGVTRPALYRRMAKHGL
ncbi:MAG: response regulator [Steroidobacteraceae bacterium]